jgi:hypothetical protein
MSAIASHEVNATVAATARRRVEFKLAAASRSAPTVHEKTDCKRDYCASDSAGQRVTGALTRSFLNRTCCRAFQEYLKFRIFQGMRVRVLKHGEGVVDGVSLRCLVPGSIYDVNPTLGHFLVTNGLAEELLPASDPALVIPLDTPYAIEQLTRGITVLPPGGIVTLEKRRRTSARRKTTRSDRRRN